MFVVTSLLQIKAMERCWQRREKFKKQARSSLRNGRSIFNTAALGILTLFVSKHALHCFTSSVWNSDDKRINTSRLCCSLALNLFEYESLSVEFESFVCLELKASLFGFQRFDSLFVDYCRISAHNGGQGIRYSQCNADETEQTVYSCLLSFFLIYLSPSFRPFSSGMLPSGCLVWYAVDFLHMTMGKTLD